MASNNSILICTDLDRTLLPNGQQAESPRARPLFRRLVQRPEVQLVYVTGRDQGLLRDAIGDFDIPLPDFAITDVGTTIYAIEQDNWTIWDSWHTEIGNDWGSYTQQSLAELLEDIKELQLQETSKQGKYKLSYYAEDNTETDSLFNIINTRFHNRDIRANLIWSIDETRHIGLLDILPYSANKLHAIHFLMQQQQYPHSRVVFSGDSGNDLEVLSSDIQAVLVNNATPEVRQQAIKRAKHNGHESRLYLARGDFLGMNGNYAAGILEGLAHYLPETLTWLKTE